MRKNRYKQIRNNLDFIRAVSTLAVADVDIFLFDVTDDTITTGNNYLAHVPGQFKYSTPSDYVFGNTSITPADLNRASMDIVRQQIVVAAGRQVLEKIECYSLHISLVAGLCRRKNGVFFRTSYIRPTYPSPPLCMYLGGTNYYFVSSPFPNEE